MLYERRLGDVVKFAVSQVQNFFSRYFALLQTAVMDRIFSGKYQNLLEVKALILATFIEVFIVKAQRVEKKGLFLCSVACP